MIVVDTNLLCYFFLKGEFSALAESAFRKDPHWIAPILWRSEFRNVLALYIRKSIFSLEQAQEITASAEIFMRSNEYSVPSQDVLALAVKSGLSAYDCEFVSLARDTGAALVTADKQIASAFPETSILLENFIG